MDELTCLDCGAEGHLVETITDMIVWVHVDPDLEDQHDFNPEDGRVTVIYDPTDGD